MHSKLNVCILSSLHGLAFKINVESWVDRSLKKLVVVISDSERRRVTQNGSEMCGPVEQLNFSVKLSD